MPKCYYWRMFSGVNDSIISIFQSGINFAFSVVIYFNQKIKHENFGVELLVKSMVIEHEQVDEGS